MAQFTYRDAVMAAWAADDAYQAELVRQFGSKNATHYRYHDAAKHNAATAAARDAKLAADRLAVPSRFGGSRA